MNEHEDTGAAAAARGEAREALLLRAGGLAFAVYAEECEALTPWAEPAPLPSAPPCVLGVTPVRGRMRTVLDPARLFESAGHADAGLHADAERRPTRPRLVASLTGDEQLALAVETSEAVTLSPEEAAHAPSPALPARAAFTRGGETVHLLDPARLFDAAMSGAERRRRRT